MNKKIPEGPFVVYHDNGKLSDKGTFRNGVLDGPFESYYDNGQLKDKGTYKNGPYLDGLYESYLLQRNLN